MRKARGHESQEATRARAHGRLRGVSRRGAEKEPARATATTRQAARKRREETARDELRRARDAEAPTPVGVAPRADADDDAATEGQSADGDDDDDEGASRAVDDDASADDEGDDDEEYEDELGLSSDGD